MFSNNGIARAGNDTFYVVSSVAGKLNILERQADDTLVLTDVISTGKSKEGCFLVTLNNSFPDRPLDNVSVDGDGVVWVAGE
jgi:arylesterase/paraoxonase